MDQDTIAAIATAPGQAGVGIVRVSGPAARRIGERLSGTALEPRKVRFREFRDAAGEVLDSGLVLFFAGPRSFTGEDVVEFQGHGGLLVLDMLLEQIMAAGARLARPGEFTERAYLNGKMDLTQAEAVADLIAGASEAAVRGANRSLSGAFSARVNEIDQSVVELRMFVEAAIDFPDEDIDLLADGQVAVRIADIIEALNRLRDDCAQGVILRDGIKLALIGAPNVGKSSLLNRLAGESRAIVTDIPGTTRDLVRADLSLGGLPVEIIDTAGLRTASDAVEAEGVRRALAEAREADIVLLVDAFDDSNEWSVDDLEVPESVDPGRVIRLLNKVDRHVDSGTLANQASAANILAVSATTGFGIDELRAQIRRRAGFSPQVNLFTARKRHLLALEAALENAQRAVVLATGTMPGELIAEELKAVHGSLGDIVGEMSSDELLGEIFSRFCIGK